MACCGRPRRKKHPTSKSESGTTETLQLQGQHFDAAKSIETWPTADSSMKSAGAEPDPGSRPPASAGHEGSQEKVSNNALTGTDCSAAVMPTATVEKVIEMRDTGGDIHGPLPSVVDEQESPQSRPQPKALGNPDVPSVESVLTIPQQKVVQRQGSVEAMAMQSVNPKRMRGSDELSADISSTAGGEDSGPPVVCVDKEHFHSTGTHSTSEVPKTEEPEVLQPVPTAMTVGPEAEDAEAVNEDECEQNGQKTLHGRNIFDEHDGWDEIAKRRRRQKAEKGEEEHHEAAATIIQAYVRGRSTRRGMPFFYFEQEKDLRILQLQSFFRGWLTRRAIYEEHIRARGALKKKQQRQRWLRVGGGVKMNVEFFMSPRPEPKPSRARVNRIEIPSTSTNGCSIDDIEIMHMQRGFEVRLYDDQSLSTPLSFLWLTSDMRHFHWRTTDVDGGMDRFARLPMESVQSIVFGPCTNTFRRRGDVSQLVADPWQCFSFITNQRSFDFASTHDRDARTLIVGVQLIKCAGQRKYVRKGVLLWQTARMRLKHRAAFEESPVHSSLAQLLRSSLADRIDEERRGRRQNWLRSTGGVELPTDFFISADHSPCRQEVRTRTALSEHSAQNSSRANGPRVQLHDVRGQRKGMSSHARLAIHSIKGPEIARLIAGLEVVLYEGANKSDGNDSLPRCTITLQANLTAFDWIEHAGKKRQGTLSMASIKSIVFGPCTDTFRRYNSAIRSVPWRCFSFITAAGSTDFASLNDQDARTVIVGVQLVKCAGQRQYVRYGVLLWQTARMRLKRRAMEQNCGIYEAFAQLLRSASPSTI
eukprot:SAG31_NODE_3021_length_4780_cov_10.795770_1_plen_815_part_00